MYGRFRAFPGAIFPVTLTTHGIVGGAIVGLLPSHPIVGLCLAFASHFLLDSIPHWDYPIRSDSVRPEKKAVMKYDWALLADAITIGTDAILGLALALILFGTVNKPGLFILVGLGASAAILPDALQFAYARFPREPLASLQRFHEWIHTSYQMRKQPVVGVVSQIAFVAIVVLMVRGIADWII
jgi:hypothetical protein